MMILKQVILPLLTLIFLSGCFKQPEPIIKIKYIKEPKYEFQILKTKNLIYNIKTIEERNICSKHIIEVGYIYRSIIDYYEESINEYRRKK